MTQRADETYQAQRSYRAAGLFAWMRLARVYQKLQRREALHLATFNLTVAQFDVLAQLSAREGITQQQLADLLLVTKGNVCGIVDRMSDQGWIERRPDPADKRSNLLYMTDDGRTLADQVVPVHSEVMNTLLDALSPNDQRTLYGLLRRLEGALDDS